MHAAAGVGIDAIDVPFLDLNDEDGLREAAIQAQAKRIITAFEVLQYEP